MPRNCNWSLTAPLVQILILAGLALPYFINLDKSALWDGNETFYAETPREMLQSRDFLAPMFNYEPRPQKPPLTYWMVLLGYGAVGVRELGVRLPGALASFGTILFAFGIARTLFSVRAGLFAAAVTATSLRVFVIARKLPIDALLLFWLAGAAFFFIRAMRNNARSQMLLAYVFTALGFMTKGPVAPAIACTSFALWSLWARRFRAQCLYPFSGILVFAAISLPWYAWTYVHHGWTYIANFFLDDNLARFATEVRGPVRGPFYYFAVFFADFFPWSLLGVAAAGYLWHTRKSLATRDQLAFGFPVVWCAVTFVLFSISKNKQEYYIVPLYPLAAVLLAGVVDRVFLSGESLIEAMHRFWKPILIVVGAVFFAAALVLPGMLPPLIPAAPRVLHFAPSLLLILTAGIVVRRAIQGRHLPGILALTISMWTIFLLAGTVYLPALEPLRPVKAICRAIQAEARPGDEIGYYRAAVPSMTFYLQRQVFSVSHPPAMEDRFRSPVTVFCVMGNRDYLYFTNERGIKLHVLGRYRQLPTQLRIMLGKESPTGEGNELLLVSNRAPAATRYPGQIMNP